ncbi:MAG: hypothetical protein ACI9SJ_001164 [Flavobacteriaceae bacterium]|jgi:hypothetical protein
MKQLNQQFKQILESKCLTKAEKIYMRKIFRDFVNRRKIIARNSIQLIDENDFEQGYQLDSIIGEYQGSYF